MMLKFILIFCLWCISALQVYPANWVEVSKNVYVDSESIQKYKLSGNSDEAYSLWMRYYDDNSLPWKNYSKVYKQKIIFVQGMQIINCNKKMVTVKVLIDYGENNTLLRRYDFPDEFLIWKIIAPSTLGDDMHQALCVP